MQTAIIIYIVMLYVSGFLASCCIRDSILKENEKSKADYLVGIFWPIVMPAMIFAALVLELIIKPLFKKLSVGGCE